MHLGSLLDNKAGITIRAVKAHPRTSGAMCVLLTISLKSQFVLQLLSA
jgi:hypothetical protein